MEFCCIHCRNFVTTGTCTVQLSLSGPRLSQLPLTKDGNPTDPLPSPGAPPVVESLVSSQQGPLQGVSGQTVQPASTEDLPGGGHKHCLKFSAEGIVQRQGTVNCMAEVLCPPMGQDSAPEATCTFEGKIGKNPEEEDNTFYQKLKSMKEPLEAQNIFQAALEMCLQK